MRRAIYAILFAAVAVTAWIAYRASETIVVERPTLGGPPPQQRVPPTPNAVGRSLPPIAGVDAATLHNRVVVVTVGATWCRPCRDELPRIENEIARVHPDDVTVVKISAENADAARRIPALFGHHGLIPRTYVADRAGIIRYQHIGYSPRTFGDLVAVVERLTRQPAL